MKVYLSCMFCSEDFETECPTPKGWEYADEFYEEDCLCPKHAPLKEWFDSVCSGCVECFQDCNLARSYQSSKETITQEDKDTIKVGRCPYRTNGTMFVNRTEQGVSIEKVDLSEQASAESGKLLVETIEEYRKQYFGEKT